ncbi:MAG: carboxymuconolactone decarboxylase family protein [Propionibacteriaceae bacterium]|nr:carboxymuconolactone decarboxylase family protein [Propionibacteriaceae bacterium]
MVSRLPGLLPSQLDADQAELYSTITGGPRSGQAFSMMDEEGRLLGPFDALLRAPALGSAVQQIGVQLRYHAVLAARERELIILTVAAHWRSSYEWYAHAAVAREQELASESELTALMAREVPASCSDRERAMLRVAEELLRDRSVAEDTYREARAHLDDTELTEIVVCTGYYWLLAALLETYQIGSPAPEVDPFGHGTG